MRYKVSDGTITYVCDTCEDDTTPEEVAKDFVKGYDTNREPITDVDVCVMDEDGNELLETTLDIQPDDYPSFEYCG